MDSPVCKTIGKNSGEVESSKTPAGIGKIVFFILAVLIVPCQSAWPKEYAIMTEECRPWGYVENGKLTGLSVEIVREILKELGHPDNIEVLPWARAYNHTLKGPDRILFSVGRSAEREPLFKWLGPIVSNRCYFFKKRGSPVRIESIEDAKKVEFISVTRNFMEHNLLESKGFSNLDLTFKPEQNVMKLVAGRVDLITSGEVDLPYIALNAGVNPNLIEKTRVMIHDSKLYIAFSKDIPDDEIEKWKKAFDHVEKSGKYLEIKEKYTSVKKH